MSYLVANPEDRFSLDKPREEVALLFVYLNVCPRGVVFSALPLGAWGRLRFYIVAIPGDLSLVS